MSNPLTDIRNAIEAGIGAHWDSLPSDNLAVVKIGNRWAKNRAKPAARLPADFPAADIRPAQDQNQSNIKASSSSGLFVRAFELGIATDEKPWDDPDAIDEAEWQLIRAAAKMQRDKLGLACVTDVLVGNTRQTPAGEQLQQSSGAARWTGAVVIAVKFQSPHAELIPT